MKIGDIEIAFKPEFGNETYIRIVELLARIRKNKVLHDKKVAEAKGARAIAKQIEEDRKNVISLISFANKEKNNGQS